MTDEKILGIIPNVQSGLLGTKAYNLIVTNNGIVVAQLTNKMIKEEMDKTHQAAKERGEGFLSRIGSQMDSRATFHKRYLSMNREQILSENEGNFFISEPEIKKIRITEGQQYEEEKATPHKLKIIWQAGKEKFSFNQITTREAKEILRKLVGKKIK